MDLHWTPASTPNDKFRLRINCIHFDCVGRFALPQFHLFPTRNSFIFPFRRIRIEVQLMVCAVTPTQFNYIPSIATAGGEWIRLMWVCAWYGQLICIRIHFDHHLHAPHTLSLMETESIVDPADPYVASMWNTLKFCSWNVRLIHFVSIIRSVNSLAIDHTSVMWQVVCGKWTYRNIQMWMAYVLCMFNIYSP